MNPETASLTIIAKLLRKLADDFASDGAVPVDHISHLVRVCNTQAEMIEQGCHPVQA